LTWTDTFNRIAEHYAALAMTPGCWAYAQQRVAQMEQDDCWQGLRAAVGQRIKTAGFRPAPADQGNWWDVPSRLLPLRPRRGA